MFVWPNLYAIFAQVGPVDILVNNAGITRDMLTMMMKPNDFTDVINLNLNGVFFCSQVRSSCMHFLQFFTYTRTQLYGRLPSWDL